MKVSFTGSPEWWPVENHLAGQEPPGSPSMLCSVLCMWHMDQPEGKEIGKKPSYMMLFLVAGMDMGWK